MIEVMAKSRNNISGNEFTFEQLELALESAIGSGLENDERIQRLSNDSNDSQINAINRRISSNRSLNQNALQRNRNNYCNIHRTHHQHYHSIHSNHCSHNNHNNHFSIHNQHNIHNNRLNSHSIHCNQQEMGLNEEQESQEWHPMHGQPSQAQQQQHQQHYTLDQSEFERIWRQLDNNKDRYNLLRSLYRSYASPNLIFSEISFGSLGDIASALCEFEDTVDDFCFVIYTLNSLSRAKRFLLSLQFMTCEERQECKKLFHKLWKSMNDKQQDLAENDISELTINQLMKSYEIAIE
jgi:hypothetical protein